MRPGGQPAQGMTIDERCREVACVQPCGEGAGDWVK